MTFFITSAGKGDGANLGGIAGADAHCSDARAGVGHAAAAGQNMARVPQRHRRRRKADQRARSIGAGPWHNKGRADRRERRRSARRHHPRSQSDEQGERDHRKGCDGEWRGRHAEHARHSHGIGLEGRAVAGTADWNCNNWSSNSATGSTMLGHSRPHRRRHLLHRNGRGGETHPLVEGVLFRSGCARLLAGGDQVLDTGHGQERRYHRDQDGGGCSAPTWVMNAARSTIGKRRGDLAPGTAANMHVNASPAASLGRCRGRGPRPSRR